MVTCCTPTKIVRDIKHWNLIINVVVSCTPTKIVRDIKRKVGFFITE